MSHLKGGRVDPVSCGMSSCQPLKFKTFEGAADGSGGCRGGGVSHVLSEGAPFHLHSLISLNLGSATTGSTTFDPGGSCSNDVLFI